MIYRQFQEDTLSLLGFGAMRLPILEDKSVDEEQTLRMIDYAMAHGVNYYDTAWPYMSSQSERILGKALSRYLRESYRIATKFPGHMIMETYDAPGVFEEQLRRCRVDYFDYYLLHNVYENSMATYLDPRWGIVPYLVEQRKAGRIRHLGFSTHADLPVLKEFLDTYGAEMEFCLIQLNYVDWTLENAKEKLELLAEYDLPVWVMEPVRGGKLASLPEPKLDKLHSVLPGVTAAEASFRWLMQFDSIKMILSGMSAMEQMEENVAVFEAGQPLTEEGCACLMEIAEELKQEIPCTACRYCCDSCPMGLDIPDLINKYNQVRFGGGFNVRMKTDALPVDKLPSACINCGACVAVCPQKIAIPEELAKLAEELEKAPSWAVICRARAEAERQAKEAEEKNRKETLEVPDEKKE